MTQPFPPQKRRSLWPWIIGIGILAVLVLCFAGALAVSNSSPSNSPDVQLVPARTSAPAKAAAPKRTNKPSSIGEGMWEVGVDVSPGKYRTSGAVKGLFEFCSWTVRASDDPDSRVIDLGSSNANEPGRVTLKAGQSFDTSGCEAWTKQ